MTLSHYIILLDTLARFRLRAETRRYYLGYLWWILEPLLYVAVFYIVFEKLLNARQPEFLVSLMVGKLTFIWFSKSVTHAATSLELNKGLMAQLDIPKHLFPLSVLHEGLYRQSAVFAFLGVFLVVEGHTPNALWWWLLALFVIQYLLIVGVALIAALLVCVQRDFQVLVQLGMVFLLFMSGIFWDIRSIQDPVVQDWLLRLNPMAVLVDAYRQVLLWNEVPSASYLTWVLAEALALLALGALCYRRLHFWINERVITR